MTNNPTNLFGPLLLYLAVSLSACAEPHNDTNNHFDYESLAIRLIAANKLTNTSTSCLTLEKASEGNSQFVEIYVREKHDSKCPGDPSSQPLLFTIRIDRSSHFATTDANSDDGDFESIK